MGVREILALVATLGAGPTVAELVGLLDDGETALVVGSGVAAQEGAKRARSIVPLHAAHIGAKVLLVHEDGNLALPIVIGVLRGRDKSALPNLPGMVEVQADGRRLVVSATDQLTL